MVGWRLFPTSGKETDPTFCGVEIVRWNKEATALQRTALQRTAKHCTALYCTLGTVHTLEVTEPLDPHFPIPSLLTHSERQKCSTISQNTGCSVQHAMCNV